MREFNTLGPVGKTTLFREVIEELESGGEYFRNLPSLLGGTQSPFNIAEQFTIPYFSAAEVAALFTGYTSETGQQLEPAVIAGIVNETEGQPVLVNRLGQIMTQDLVPERDRPITEANLNYALARLVGENNSHFYSMLSKATPHRQRLLPMLFYHQSRTDFLDDVTQDLIMYGVLRVVEDENSLRYARIGNPIYRKMLLLRFATPPEPLPIDTIRPTEPTHKPQSIRAHSAFLNSYAPEDEGLYDDDSTSTLSAKFC